MNIDLSHPFWSKVDIKDRANCWQWLASIRGDGYGQYHFDERNQGAHRVAFQLAIGEIPNGLHVCHHCDNKECVNPDHLYLATNRQNLIDAGRRGLLKQGESHPLHKLTVEDVKEIRLKYIPWVITMQMLADEYGVAINTIQQVVKRGNWKSIL